MGRERPYFSGVKQKQDRICTFVAEREDSDIPTKDRPGREKTPIEVGLVQSPEPEAWLHPGRTLATPACAARATRGLRRSFGKWGKREDRVLGSLGWSTTIWGGQTR